MLLAVDMGDHATRQDLRQLEDRLLKAIGNMKDELIEKMRDMQTELLRGFEAHAAGMTIRMRKLEAGPLES